MTRKEYKKIKEEQIKELEQLIEWRKNQLPGLEEFSKEWRYVKKDIAEYEMNLRRVKKELRDVIGA